MYLSNSNTFSAAGGTHTFFINGKQDGATGNTITKETDCAAHTLKLTFAAGTGSPVILVPVENAVPVVAAPREANAEKALCLHNKVIA